MILKEKLNFENSKWQFTTLNGEKKNIIDGIRTNIECGENLIKCTIKNETDSDFAPKSASVILGVDTCMNSYPEWNDKFFPSLLRCEKTHLWGVLKTPNGECVILGTDAPVASWSLVYNKVSYDDGLTYDGGHLIMGISLDLIHKLPLPQRHPQDIYTLGAGEEKSWTIFFKEAKSEEDILPAIAEITNAPALKFDRLTVYGDEKATLTIFGAGEHEVKTKNGTATKNTDGTYNISVQDFGECIGEVACSNGKTSEFRIYKREKFSWYIKQAAKNAEKYPQQATTHMESLYGFFPAFATMRYFKDEVEYKTAKEDFYRILNLLNDTKTGEPIYAKTRLNNSGIHISALTSLYLADGDKEALIIAERIANFIISKYQSEKGEFLREGINYTSVVYIAKSILELAIVLRGVEDEFLKERGKFFEVQIEKTMDRLAELGDWVETEGEVTFEDGSISCAALQLGFFALNGVNKPEYLKISEMLMNEHKCLELLHTPDARISGGTIRFWEAQYDVFIKANLINSPHGWSAWTMYAKWYLYLLTGDVCYLNEFINGIGACIALIDIDGNLRWSFCPDPYIDAYDALNKCDIHLGESYMNMIADKTPTPKDRAVFGYDDGTDEFGSCDNDVHEIFKCLEETSLLNAVLHIEDEKVTTFNCAFEKGILTPYEDIINSVYAYTDNPMTIIVFGKEVQIENGFNRIEK